MYAKLGTSAHQQVAHVCCTEGSRRKLGMQDAGTQGRMKSLLPGWGSLALQTALVFPFGPLG